MIQDESGTLTLKVHGICLTRADSFIRQETVWKKSLKATRLQKKYKDKLNKVGVDQPTQCEFNM